jgi:hypothetical protein
MAKKSKRSKRLKKLAKVLGAGLAIAGLGRAFANRNKTSAADVNSGRGGDSSSAMARVLANTPEENTFKVQDVKVNVPSTSSTFESRMTPANRGVNYDNPSGTVGTNKKASIRSINAAKMAAPKNITGPFSYMNPYVEPDMYSMAAAKKGGRIVKTKSGGKALRGYGRAYKGGKK